MLRLKVVSIALGCLLLAVTACQVQIPAVAALEVKDQEVTGNSISIPKVDMDKPGWLVIRPADHAGRPDAESMLVQAYLVAGKYKDVGLPLGTSISGEVTVFAMLYYDEPADKKFTFSMGGTEDPPVEVEGSAVSRSFKITGAQLTPAVEVESQSIQDNTITISRVVLDEPGWIAIHGATPQGELDASVVLSLAYISVPGEYTSVNIPFTAAVSGEQTVFVMLHYDDPADGDYTFTEGGSADLPVQFGGSDVVESFSLQG